MKLYYNNYLDLKKCLAVMCTTSPFKIMILFQAFNFVSFFEIQKALYYIILRFCIVRTVFTQEMRVLRINYFTAVNKRL